MLPARKEHGEGVRTGGRIPRVGWSGREGGERRADDKHVRWCGIGPRRKVNTM